MPPSPRSPGLRPLPRVLLAAGLALSGCTADGKVDTGVEQVEDDAARRTYYEEAAQTYYDGGNYRAAEEQWNKVLKIDPNDPKANWGLAMSLAKQGDPGSLRAAEKILVKILPWDWSHPTLGDRRHEVEKDLAQVYLELAEHYDRDVRVLQEIRKEGNDPEVQRKIQTQVAARDGLLRQSMPLFSQVLQRSPENPYALAGLAEANLLVGNEDAGIDYARRYIALSRKSQENWQRTLVSFQKENELVTENQRMHFKTKIAGAREKELKMHLLVATVLMRRGNYPGAVAEYDRVLELDPARPAAYVERAQAHAGMREWRKAIADVQEYLKITDPIRHKAGRISAADLLNRYRAADEASRGAPLVPTRVAAPRPAAPSGSPDG
jgi:tetratricopeptide (TPR) repeat protein